MQKGSFSMVYGVIDNKSFQYYTCLGKVFNAIGNAQQGYNWLISDCEVIAHSEQLDKLNTRVYWQYPNRKPVAVPAPDYHFLSGEELTNIITEDDSQWIWGVLSGFEKSIPLEEILKYPLPEADGYGGFWKDPPSIQHPLASVEIVPWDSGLVLLFSRSREIVDSFKAALPESRDIREYNA